MSLDKAVFSTVRENLGVTIEICLATFHLSSLANERNATDKIKVQNMLTVLPVSMREIH